MAGPVNFGPGQEQTGSFPRFVLRVAPPGNSAFLGNSSSLLDGGTRALAATGPPVGNLSRAFRLWLEQGSRDCYRWATQDCHHRL